MSVFQRDINDDLSMRQTLIWWEMRRILYNFVMFIVGNLSFFLFGYVTMPLIYMLIAINLNILYTFSWILEITIFKQFHSDELTRNYVKWFSILFYSYSIIAVLFYMPYPKLLNWTLIPYGF